MRWRLLRTAPLDGAVNMALDVALMERARETGEAVFRVYGWSAPTVSFGRNQKVAGTYDARRIDSAGVRVVRRPTGGRTILHWREVTYSVTAPSIAFATRTAAYERITSLVLEGLRRLGAHARIATPEARSRQPDSRPCFAEPAAGEIVVRCGEDDAVRKLVASAQHCEAGALLQHGSILIDDDQPLLLRFAAAAVAQPLAGTLNAALSRAVEADEVGLALFDAVQALVDPAAKPLCVEDVLSAAEPHMARFRDPLWTWRT